jgi:magnesium chelatase family protein
VDVSNGLPKECLTGLPDASIKESKNRIRTALKNSGFKYPPQVVTINLAPADLHKEGTMYDLPIAVGILQSTGQTVISEASVLYVGELSLKGEVKPIRGVVPICHFALKQGIKYVVIPQDNLEEASLISGVIPVPISSLNELIDLDFSKFQSRPSAIVGTSSCIGDLSDVRGQFMAKRALEIAATGYHNILLIGSPGSGKTMLIKRLPSILPLMSMEESIETYKVYSVYRRSGVPTQFQTSRPFRSPHHSISHVGLVGGGKSPQPGEISLAHNGVLFLDELPEFNRLSIESLRQPLEDQKIHISRANFSVEFPARVLFAAAMNPCPCGYHQDARTACRCHPQLVRHYWKKISGPLLDRVDMVIDVPRVTGEDFSTDFSVSESSEVVRERVSKCWDIQASRFGRVAKCNAQMSVQDIAQFCELDGPSQVLLRDAVNMGILTGRSYHKVVRLARTIADMAGRDHIEYVDVAEAMQYRPSRELI